MNIIYNIHAGLGSLHIIAVGLTSSYRSVLKVAHAEEARWERLWGRGVMISLMDDSDVVVVVVSSLVGAKTYRQNMTPDTSSGSILDPLCSSERHVQWVSVRFMKDTTKNWSCVCSFLFLLDLFMMYDGGEMSSISSYELKQPDLVNNQAKCQLAPRRIRLFLGKISV